jgi:hypothetical protein
MLNAIAQIAVQANVAYRSFVMCALLGLVRSKSPPQASAEKED